MNIPILSFFTGGGLLDIGFEKAGFEILWTNEFHPVFANIYDEGMTSWRRSLVNSNKSISTISERASIADLGANKIISSAFGSIKPKFWGVIGGPPCQDFSIAGKNKGIDGDRGQLTQVFVDRICEMQPDFFVIENVPGLCHLRHRSTFDKIIKQLSCENLVANRLLSALELGVPQDRDRLFILGFKRHLFSSISPKHPLLSAKEWFEWPAPKFHAPKLLCWPMMSPFGSDLVLPPDVPDELTVYPLLTNNVEKLANGQDIFVAYSKKFWEIKEGDVSRKSFKRLHRYRYSPTAWYGNNEVHLHPWLPRRLSVREAMRIQTVPDEYVLPKEIGLTHKFKVICNGVPCRMAESLGHSILEFIKKENLLD